MSKGDERKSSCRSARRNITNYSALDINSLARGEMFPCSSLHENREYYHEGAVKKFLYTGIKAAISNKSITQKLRVNVATDRLTCFARIEVLVEKARHTVFK